MTESEVIPLECSYHFSGLYCISNAQDRNLVFDSGCLIYSTVHHEAPNLTANKDKESTNYKRYEHLNLLVTARQTDGIRQTFRSAHSWPLLSRYQVVTGQWEIARRSARKNLWYSECRRSVIVELLHRSARASSREIFFPDFLHL